jgi:hypothetical protein
VKAGSTVLARDYVNRQWFSTLEGEPLEDKLYDRRESGGAQGYIDAYTRGVNAWIGDMKRREATARRSPPSTTSP